MRDLASEDDRLRLTTVKSTLQRSQVTVSMHFPPMQPAGLHRMPQGGGPWSILVSPQLREHRGSDEHFVVETWKKLKKP